ncbi:DUF5117 domain-containing protein [Candidatus Bathyarchaeota archaeon]|nr:MAG: DUF5117 domain-containing protein [Candidatus Bathyarchaeota archaeon]
MEKHPGYFTYYWDPKKGKLWLEIDKLETEFLYVNSLKAGVGSNDIGLDRNQLGDTKVVKFQRIGPKILLTQVNYGYRALSDNPQEKEAVEDAFAKSVIGGFTVEAEEEESVLVDATDFFLRDAKQVVQRLKEKEQGEYELDPKRSALHLPATKNFPKNTEIEAILTYQGKIPGDWVKSVVPDPENITVRQHHSLIELPDDKYTPRRFDIRSSYFSEDFMDYASPVTEPLEKRYICRHRLNKKDPNAKVSEPVEPIIYYVDPGVPELIRSALVEGAHWWNIAYEHIGYKDAFRVEILPEDADPMDIRYNVINWVHRSTRGWSYGMTVTDPRTGEIIKGHVSLGSLRIRQDFMIAMGLMGEYTETGDNSGEAFQMALARIRQLSVHEVGHTLGLGHNYASNINNRSSVMDYPAMWVKEKDGELDLSDAYAIGLGEWDLVSIEYGYQDYTVGTDEGAELDKLLNSAFSRGLLFQPSRDAGPGSPSPYAAYWINGVDPVDELYRMMRVRKIALAGFGEHRVRYGTPLASMEEPLVTTYLFHRFQLESTASVLGGLYYHYKVRGDVQEYPRVVPAEKQAQGLDALLETVTPEALALPDSLLDLMHPRPQHLPQTRDLFPGRTGLTFDPMAAAETAAGMTISLILHPERAARLMEYHARDPGLPGLGDVIDRLLEATWLTIYEDTYHQELQRLVNHIVLYYMVELVKNKDVPSMVRTLTHFKLIQLNEKVAEVETDDEPQLAQYLILGAVLDLLEDNPEAVKLTPPAEPPMGAPI